MSADQPDISLVIPAYNEAGYLGRTLEYVDQARAAYGAHGATVLVEEKRCIAAVRNRGARCSSGRILAFLDADSLVSRSVFNSIRETMSSGKYVGGSTDVKLDRMSVGLFVTMCLTVYPARRLLGVSGGLYFVERSAFEEVGGFDEGLYCAEDSAFLLALRQHAKRSGKGFLILKHDITTTSARSFDRLGDWYYVLNLPRILLNGGVRAFRSAEFCRRFWYDAGR